MDKEEFKTTDFVQVECFIVLPSGEPVKTWRNALFVGYLPGPVVIYTDGTKEALNRDTRIRLAKPEHRQSGNYANIEKKGEECDCWEVDYRCVYCGRMNF